MTAAQTGKLDSASDLLDQLFALMGVILRQGRSHRGAVVAAGELQQRILRQAPPFNLRFIRGAVYLDDTLLSLPADTYARAQQLAAALWNLDRHELQFHGVPDTTTLQTLGAALARGAQVKSDVLDRLQLDDVSFLQVPYGAADDRVEPERLASHLLARAVERAADAARHCPPWDWSLALGVLRDLERSLAAAPHSVIASIGDPTQPTRPAQRALASVTWVLLALEQTGTPTELRRAAAEAALVFGTFGLKQGRAREPLEAATDALSALLSDPDALATGHPHRNRVCSLVALLRTAIARGQPGPAATDTGLPGLLCTSYELERTRLSTLPISLNPAEALGRLVSRIGLGPWSRVLLAAVGIPAGTCVLADGRLGLVVAQPATNPLRPEVMHGKERSIPSGPVRIHSPLT